MHIENVPLTVTCPKCGSTDIANLTGDDDAVVSCSNCGKEFGTAAEVRGKVMADATKQATKVAKKALGSTLRKLNRRR